MFQQLFIIATLLYEIESAPEKDEKCWFSDSRSRVPDDKLQHQSSAMRVSTGTCTTKLFSADDLMVRNNARNYFGAFDGYDLIQARGSAVYRRSPDHANEQISDIHVCEAHVKELLTDWGKEGSKHIRYHHVSEKHILSCSWPIEPHNPPQHLGGRIKAYRLTREEAKGYFMSAGQHLHVGLPLCKQHHDHVLNSIAEKKEEKCDKPWSPGDHPDETMFVEEKETAEQAAFVSFCRVAEIDRVCPKSSFVDYVRDTKIRKIRTIEKIWWKTLEMVTPGMEMEVWDRVCKKGKYDEWDGVSSEAHHAILEQMHFLWLMAEDARTRDIILSQVAGPMSFPQLLPFFPGLSHHKFYNAKRVWASQELPPKIVNTKQRWSTEGSLYFHDVHVPWGVKTVTLSTGEKIEIPNIVREYTKAETIRGFKKWMEEIHKSDLVYSDSTLMRLMKAAPSTQRRSMACVDSFKSMAYEAFDEIKKMIDRLVALSKLDKDDAHKLWNQFLEIRLYLKHDFFLHVTQDSKIADHSLIFALSDPYNHNFAIPPSHEHKDQCQRCTHIETTFREMSDLLSSIQLTDPSDEIDEMIFNFNDFRDSILALKAHAVRIAYTEGVHRMHIEGLEEGQADDYYAKKGNSWSFGYVTANVSNTLVTHQFIHFIEDDPQDSRSSVTIVTQLLHVLKLAGIESVYIRSDNAANYHCAQTLGSIPSIAKTTGVKILAWSFSASQNGKGAPDRAAANAKFAIRAEVNAGRAQIRSQMDMFNVLKNNHTKGVSVYIGRIKDPQNPPKTSLIERVTDYSYFKTEGDGLRVWKYHNIGKGEVFTKLYSNAGVYEKIAEGGAMADLRTAETESMKIKIRAPAEFWNYNPMLLETKETGDRDYNEAVQPLEEKKGGIKGLTFACWCGATFLQHGNYINHLDYGVHKIHPLKVTGQDEMLKMYGRCLENYVGANSLASLQDASAGFVDKTVRILSMGWGLRSAKKHGRYPEKTKEMIKKFAVERRKERKRADPEVAFKRFKKTFVLRARRSEVAMEEDLEEDVVEWKVVEVEEGEWEIEEECDLDEEGDEFDVMWNHFNEKTVKDEIFEP